MVAESCVGVKKLVFLHVAAMNDEALKILANCEPLTSTVEHIELIALDNITFSGITQLAVCRYVKCMCVS